MKKLLYLFIFVFAVAACSKNDGSIIGKASADGGNVVQGITVKLYNEEANFISETTTDSQGDFAFHGLEAGNYYVAATITVGGEIWDTGNTPQMVYVGDEIVKEVTLTLNKK
ncbi:MAG: carboxypeptidase regulatory-like domain-containing protein [Lentimicrobium sp.]|nr:carboxypeptidase regulatory-like domain-containing protein [Lentimicrobium sp.]